MNWPKDILIEMEISLGVDVLGNAGYDMKTYQ
jgi:hypothetical protein